MMHLRNAKPDDQNNLLPLIQKFASSVEDADQFWKSYRK